MKKQAIALTLALVLALALSASAQADMDAATALVDAYVSHYNSAVARLKDQYDIDITPIEPTSKGVAGVAGNQFICYSGRYDPYSAQSQAFLFWIDDATSGISQITIIIYNLSLQDLADLEDLVHSTHLSTICFCTLTLPGITFTEDVEDQFTEKLTEAVAAHLSDDVSPLRPHKTDPISCDGLSISFYTDGNGDTFSTIFEFDPPITHDPLI